jgi:hypothetical protein
MLGKSKHSRPHSPNKRKESKVKFDVSKYNLECFLPKGPVTKIAPKKLIKAVTSRTSHHDEKPTIKNKL